MKIQGDLKTSYNSEEFNEGMVSSYRNLLSVILENYEKIKAQENAGKIFDPNSTPLHPSLKREAGDILTGGAE